MDSEVEEMGVAARSAFILSLGDFIYNAVLALGLIVIARFLGAEGYGVYSLSISVPLALYSFISLNLDTAITRYTKFYLVKGMYRSVAEVIKVSFLLKTLVGFVGTLVCFFYAKPLSSIIINRPELYNYVMMVSIAVLLESFYTYFLSVFVGFDEVWRNTILKIVYSVSRTAIAIVMLLAGFQVLGVLIAYILSFALSVTLGFIFLMLLVSRRLRSRPIENNNVCFLRIARELVIYSIPLYVSSLITSVSSVYQTMVLARALTDVEIGGYRALANFQTLILVILGPISVALLPMYTSVNAKRGKEELSRVLIKSNKYIAIVVVPLTLLAMIFARELVYLVLGPDYVFISQYIPLLFASFLLVGLGSTSIPQLFNALGMTKFNLYVSTISLAAFIPLSYLLTAVLNFKLWGFLASGIVSSIISVSMYNYFLFKMLKSSLYSKEVVSVYISSALAMMLPLVLLQIPLPRPVSLLRIALGTTLYMVFYVVFLALLRVLNEQEVEFFENAFRTIPIVNSIVKTLAKVVKTVLKSLLKH